MKKTIFITLLCLSTNLLACNHWFGGVSKYSDEFMFNAERVSDFKYPREKIPMEEIEFKANTLTEINRSGLQIKIKQDEGKIKFFYAPSSLTGNVRMKQFTLSADKAFIYNVEKDGYFQQVIVGVTIEKKPGPLFGVTSASESRALEEYNVSYEIAVIKDYEILKIIDGKTFKAGSVDDLVGINLPPSIQTEGVSMYIEYHAGKQFKYETISNGGSRVTKKKSSEGLLITP